jgi:hypothetical protein
VHTTRAQNAVLVNGEGQTPHSAQSRGEIVREQLGPAYDYIAGDATPAYAGRLEKAWRHVVFVKGTQPFIVMYDELIAPQPATFQFMLHALNAFIIDPRSARIRVEQPGAGVDLAYLSPVPLVYQQTDGFTPPPSREFPTHWHLEAGTKQARREVGMVTVFVPHRAGESVEWAAYRTEETSSTLVEITVGGKRHTMRFPRPGVGAEIVVKLAE